jgi:tetratricopeptide (TPR) repeat protein
LRNLCALERSTDEIAAAERDCRASLALAQDLHGKEYRTTIDARRQLAALYVDMGRFSEAETEFLDAYKWMRTRLDPNHPDMARTYNSLAIVAWERGDLGQAVMYQERAVAAWRKGLNDGVLADGIFNLAMILHSGNNDEKALPLIREARQLRLKRFGANHELVGDSDRLLGDILAALGQTEPAHAALLSAVRLTRSGFGRSHSHTHRAEISLARFEASGGDPAAYQRLRALGSSDQGDIELRKTSWLARAYAAQLDCAKQPAQALAELDTVLTQMQLALPEGGAIPREIEQIRGDCAKSQR